MATHARDVLLVGPAGETAAIGQTLANDGWRVIQAGAVPDAIECARRDQPSAIVFTAP